MIPEMNAENISKQPEINNKSNFLPTGNPPPKDKIVTIGNKELGTPVYVITPELLEDINNLNKTELRKKYPRTYKCWDNMKQRKHLGYIIHPEFDDFRDFLRHLGPCENKNYTLDRLDNDDPEYAPGKVQWRDKYAQNSNKGNNIYLAHDDGRTHTIAQWARITAQKPSTLYKRHKLGWSDMEVITGKRTSQVSSIDSAPWPHRFHDEWEKRYFSAKINGYQKSKIYFLREEALKIQDELQHKISKLNLAIDYKKMNIDPNDIPPLHEGYLEYVGYDINTFRITPLKKMEDQVKHSKEKMSRCEKIIKETGEQILYQEGKKECLGYKGEGISKSQLFVKFHQLYPEPIYTINQPQQQEAHNSVNNH